MLYLLKMQSMAGHWSEADVQTQLDILRVCGKLMGTSEGRMMLLR